MKSFNLVRGFFGRSKVAIPFAWDAYRACMDVANPYNPTNTAVLAVSRNADGLFRNITKSR